MKKALNASFKLICSSVVLFSLQEHPFLLALVNSDAVTGRFYLLVLQLNLLIGGPLITTSDDNSAICAMSTSYI